MVGANGKLKLVLRSKKVPVRVERFQSGSMVSGSLRAWNGPLFVSTRTFVEYEYVFDYFQNIAMTEARSLAARTGLLLEVVDLSRQTILKRWLGVLRMKFATGNGLGVKTGVQTEGGSAVESMRSLGVDVPPMQTSPH
jgi:hypothetical protein